MVVTSWKTRVWLEYFQMRHLEKVEK